MGWADVATKQDIESLRREFELQNRYVDERFERARAEWRGDLAHGLRQQLLTLLSANAVMLVIVVTVVQLLR